MKDSPCFNGAATARSRNCGPCHCGGGAGRCFNGAATARSRNCGITWFSCLGSARFNGAATARSRNSRSVRSSRRPLPQLQWGRDRAVAELHCQRAIRTTRCWLQWGRDRAVAEFALPLSYSVFKDLHRPSRAASYSPRVSSSSLVPRRRKLFKPIPLIPHERCPRFLRRPTARVRHRVMNTG